MAVPSPLVSHLELIPELVRPPIPDSVPREFFATCSRDPVGVRRSTVLARRRPRSRGSWSGLQCWTGVLFDERAEEADGSLLDDLHQLVVPAANVGGEVWWMVEREGEVGSSVNAGRGGEGNGEGELEEERRRRLDFLGVGRRHGDDGMSVVGLSELCE